MTSRVAIRELRNNTKAVIEKAAAEGEVLITNNGVVVGILRAPDDHWETLVHDLIRDAPAPFDTGMADFLAADNEQSLA